MYMYIWCTFKLLSVIVYFFYKCLSNVAEMKTYITKDVTLLLTHWSYVFLALTNRFSMSQDMPVAYRAIIHGSLVKYIHFNCIIEHYDNSYVWWICFLGSHWIYNEVTGFKSAMGAANSRQSNQGTIKHVALCELLSNKSFWKNFR